MTKYLIYTHPAVAKGNIKVGTWYSLEELQQNYTLDEIKCFFSPCNFGWEELETKSKKVIEKE
jgi:hypothetical protein